ncbi:hypothetical protein IGI04_030812, partial [Brassica rapa subsp. trilocularis]
MAIAKAILRLLFCSMFEDSRSDIFQTDLVVGWFFRDSSHESSISVVGSSLHHDEAVIRSSFVALMQNFWSDAPMVEMQQEYERRVGAVRMKRQKEFVESLIEKGNSSHQTTVVEGQVQGQLEVASEEDEDHAILEWEARLYDDVDIRQYGSFLQDDQTMEVSDTCLGKRSREELNEESIDKFPVGKMRMSAEFNALRQRNQTNSAVSIVEIRNQLDQAIRNSTVSTEYIQELRGKLNQAYRDEEEYWKLKSRNRWLNLGDRNTPFYHGLTKMRKSKNKILKMSDKYGVVHYQKETIAQ